MAASETFAQSEIAFQKVDFFEVQGEGEKSRDARLIMDVERRLIIFADEKRGPEKATYAQIPYTAVTKVVYERASHRRYKAGILVSPWLLLTKGKKHWLTIEFENVASLPQGYVALRMDKDNYRRIITAIEAGLQLEVEEIIED
jgi:hypothetical protein